MTSIETVAEAEALLAKYVPLSKEILGKDLQLGRTQKLMAALGNPQKKLKIVHIAGTSGKTSTAYYVASLLTNAGCRVGLTVSPHVDTVLERLQINMQFLDEQEFASNLSACVSMIEAAGIEPTYFELLTGFAYWYFEKIGVDYAVIETGLGGLQDATNVADNTNKLCIITDIGLDHMNVLGNTVAQIARQKAGIIHPENRAIMYRQTEEIMNVLVDWCRRQHAFISIIEQSVAASNQDLPPFLETLPDFQQRNWLLAHQAYLYLQERDELRLLSTDNLANSMKIQVPGRMEVVVVGGKRVIMDGAHNEQKTESFVSSFIQKHSDKKVPVLLSLKEGKEFSAVLPLLKPITSCLIITSFSSSQDLPANSIDPNELAKAAKKFGIQNIIIQPDQNLAYQELINQPDDMAIITGSFYLIGQLRSRHPELHSA